MIIFEKRPQNRYIWFHEKKLVVDILREMKVDNFGFLETHDVEKREILSHQRNISSNQLISTFFRKTVNFTKLLPKMRERKFA